MKTHDPNEITIFGETNFRNERKRFGIKRDDRRRHMYIIGKTGVGKTVLMENMIISDIVNGNGVGVMDPHGELAEKILSFVPKERLKDVIYFNPADINNPIAFNPIEKVADDKRHLVASGLMGVFKRVWPDVWSGRMEYVLNNTIMALLEFPGSTFLGVLSMWSNKNYRKKIVEQIKDPIVKSFWKDEFASWEQRYATEATAAIQNKIGQFVAASIIRNIVGQKESAFDIRQAMDEGKILIMNLSKGRIGEDNSRLLGGLLMAKLQVAAMSRVEIENEDDRKDFFMYVDEFQNFATDSFASILSEARKYHLNLTIANQYIAQLTESVTGGKRTTVRDAVFGNVGTIVTFRVGAEDAEFLEKEFEPTFTANDLVNLPKYNIYIKLMIDGVVSRGFSAITLPPYIRTTESYKEDIIRMSREAYARDLSDVEAEIAEFSDSPAAQIGQKIMQQRKDAITQEMLEAPLQVLETDQGQKMYETICWEGGERILVPFRPDGVRPAYCKRHAGRIQEHQAPAANIPDSISLEEIRRKPEKTSQEKPKSKKKKRRRRKPNKPEVNLGNLREAISETRRGDPS
jgi:CxxC-x17-CxxC domain-containing protein